MFGLTVLVVFGVYLLISFLVVRGAIGYARKHGKSAKKWGWGAGFVMYSVVFWDWIPTVAVHQYYCAKDAGFWVYKTLDQWKAENPGVMEGLVANELRAPSIHEGNEDNWSNTYLLNQRINQVGKHQGPLPFYRWKYESALVDSKTDEVLARSVDFYTAQIRAGGGWHGWKFWLSTDHCFSYKNNAVQFGNYINLKTAVERYQPFDTPAVRATQGERLLTKTVTTPFVLSALRSKAYRSMNGVATAVFRINQIKGAQK